MLLSTHCVPSKSPEVKAAAVKVKMHLSPALFVQGCHYAGCDQATKFSSKINQPLPSTPFSLGIPREMHPQSRVSSLFSISGRGRAPCLFSFQYPFFCVLLLFAPSCLHSTLCHNPYPLFSSSPSTSTPPTFISLSLFMPISSFCISFIFNLVSLYVFSDRLSSLHLSFCVAETPCSLETGPS